MSTYTENSEIIKEYSNKLVKPDSKAKILTAVKWYYDSKSD